MSFNYPPDRKDTLDAQRAQDGEPTTYPVFKFAWNENDFTPLQREWIGIGVNIMSRLGPTCVWVVDGTHHVLVRHWPEDNSVNPTTDKKTKNAGLLTRFPDGSMIMDLDPVGLNGEDPWITAAAQETGHAFGIMDHIPRSMGPAIMNPTLAETSLTAPDLTLDTMMQAEGRVKYPTYLDRDAYDHVHRTKP
jgi:hypothetical protein